jgi:hypothetical protein
VRTATNGKDPLSYLQASKEDIGFAENWAEALIKQRIDGESRFEAAAPYELSGHDLKRVLAYAYLVGHAETCSKHEAARKLGAKAAALFEALDRKRKLGRVGLGVSVEATHRRMCPAIRSGKAHGLCDCGAFEQRVQLKDALEALREAARP